MEYLHATDTTALELAAIFANACKSGSCPVQRSTSLRRRGSKGVAWPGAPKVAGTEDMRDRAAWAHESWDRFWGRGRAVGTERSVAQDVVRVVRVLSESTNSSM